MPEVITCGETMGLFSATETGHVRHTSNWRLGIGGAESNLAVGLKRLGVDVDWFGRVGDDVFGDLILHTLRAEGLPLRHVVVDPEAPTGLMIKEQRTSTWARVHYYRAGSAGSRFSAGDIDAASIREARVLHVTGITVALSESARAAVEEAVTMAREAAVTVSVDLNYRSALWNEEAAAEGLRRLAARADILFATEEEARILVAASDPEESAHALQDLGPDEVVLKRAGDGAVVRSDDRTYRSPAVRVAAIDTVGAGDAFAAAYLAGRLRSEPVDACLRAANEAGAFSVASRGDWEGLPFASELELRRRNDSDTDR